MARFLDTNILIRFFTRDDPAKAQAAYQLIRRVERDEERVVLTPLVIFEVVFLLERRYAVAKAEIREKIGDLLSLRSVQLAEKSLCRKALDLYVEQNVAYADAYHVAWMQQQGLKELYSWDREFDRVPEVTRIEPAEEAPE